MANTPSDEELQFRRRARRRLVGAVVLVTVMIAVLPMVLDDKPRPVNPDIAITVPTTAIPGKDSSEFTSKIVPMAPAVGTIKPAEPVAAPKPEAKPEAVKPEMPAATPAAEPQKPAAPAQSVAVKPAEPKQEKAKPAPVPEAKQETAKTKETAKAREPQKESSGKDGYVVRLGAFSDAANAKKRLAELKAKGIKAYAEVVKTPGGEKTRVRAGPYANQAEADKVRDKLKAAKMDGDVVNLATEAGR